MADLSAQPKEALRPLKERKFVPIDRDNFNDVLKKSAPRLAMTPQDVRFLKSLRIATDDGE